jgi:hypothetical protein
MISNESQRFQKFKLLVFLGMLASGLLWMMLPYQPVITVIIALIALWSFLAAIIYIFGSALTRLRIRRSANRGEVHCAYCKDVLTNAQTFCKFCGSMYHEECYRINGCATFACQASRPTKQTSAIK